MFIYLYIWYMRIPYIHSALFVRDAIFSHVKDIAKLVSFESQKDVRLTYGIRRRERLRRKNTGLPHTASAMRQEP